MTICDNIQVGEPVRHEMLSVFPLFAKSNGGIDYLLSHEAISAGLVTVEEVDRAGSVADLTVENKGDTRVLFLEGEELVGAKQNRILNTSILVAAKSKTKIPVSCVEQGRWQYESQRFRSSGSHSPSRLRYALKASVSRSVNAKRGHRSDQERVWKEVERQQRAFGVASGTAAMSDTFDSCKDRIDGFRVELGYTDGASGMVVAVGRRIVALDLFDKPSTCEKVWSRLLTGVILDSLETHKDIEEAQPRDVEAFLGILDDGPWQQVETIGEGVEHRVEEAKRQGSTLLMEGVLVHASVLARE